MNLYELTESMLAVQDLLESDEYDEETIADTLDAVEGAYEYKMENCCKVIKNLEADIEALKAEAKRLTDKRRTLENNIDRLKAKMFESMKITGKEKIKGSVFTLAIQKNGGKAPVVLDVPVKELPDNLVRVKEEADIDAIRRYIDMVGDNQYAHIGDRGESLRIK